ncbi:MAG: hypothetical protein ABTD50_20655 [Polyangiaceae bacterium]|jgi:hypothetical protein
MPKWPPASSLPDNDIDSILRAQDWSGLRKRLVAVALTSRSTHCRAEELADIVIVDCCDPRGRPWNPSREPDLARHALRLLGNLMSAERRKDKVRLDPRNVAALSELGSTSVTPAQALDDAERRARDIRVIEAARARLSDPLDSDVLDLSLEGIDKAAEQAARLAVPIEGIRRARDRVKYALRAAIDEEESPWKSAVGPPKKS